jgi:alanine racemase
MVMRPTYAVIDLSKLKKNYLNIRKKTNTKVMAVVKADAYGHGVEEVVKALDSLQTKPEYYAVAFADEGVELRNLKVKQPVLIFEPFNKSQVELAFKYNLIPTVFSEGHLKLLSAGAKNFNYNKKIKIHVKVDTGMNRLGIDFKDAYDFICRINDDDRFILDGIYTHFATSDEKDKTFANLQLKRFRDLTEVLKAAGVNYGIAHTANSGAIVDMPDSYFDMVRPGISLYGYYPSLETTESIELYPVMSLISHVSSVKEIKKGDSVSYGRIYIASKPLIIASVPIGYADGFSRNLSNNAKAIIKGKIYNQIGRVTMDRITFKVDINVKEEDEVILIGKSKGLNITAWDWSKILNTIPYEVTCLISKRVPRVYKN